MAAQNNSETNYSPAIRMVSASGVWNGTVCIRPLIALSFLDHSEYKTPIPWKILYFQLHVGP